MDKELVLLNVVEESPEISQRELARRIGLSLGSINILIKKMVREGLIKLEKLPSDRALYILTPRGIEEKISKTRNYIAIHYQALEVMRSQIRRMIIKHGLHESNTMIDIHQQELKFLVLQCLGETGSRNEPGAQMYLLTDYNGYDGTLGAKIINVHDYLGAH